MVEPIGKPRRVLDHAQVALPPGQTYTPQALRREIAGNGETAVIEVAEPSPGCAGRHDLPVRLDDDRGRPVDPGLEVRDHPAVLTEACVEGSVSLVPAEDQLRAVPEPVARDRKSTRLNSSHG